MSVLAAADDLDAPAGRRMNIVSGAIGNVLEWYDFSIYGAMAPILGALFFPSDNPVTSLLAAFGVFAIGCLSRPVGGVIMGHIGDTIGRKQSLMISVAMMGICTAAIGVLPTYAAIGIAAPAFMVVLRLLQGISVGGEYPNSIVFLSEHAEDGNRAMHANWPVIGSLGGFLLGTGVAAILNTTLSHDAILSWGWRIPFLIGALLAFVCLLFRRNMIEPPSAENAEKPDEALPVVATIRDYWRPTMKIVGIALFNAVGFYMLWVYAASYLTGQMHVSTADALDISTWTLALMVPATVIFAFLSDRIGRKPVLYFASGGAVVLGVPLWWLMHHQAYFAILAGQAGFAILYSAGYASMSAVMVEILPAHVRCSATAIGYNLCMALFGGTTPVVATYLVARTADDFVPAYILVATAAISLLVVTTLKESAGKPMASAGGGAPPPP